LNLIMGNELELRLNRFRHWSRVSVRRTGWAPPECSRMTPDELMDWREATQAEVDGFAEHHDEHLLGPVAGNQVPVNAQRNRVVPEEHPSPRLTRHVERSEVMGRKDVAVRVITRQG